MSFASSDNALNNAATQLASYEETLANIGVQATQLDNQLNALATATIDDVQEINAQVAALAPGDGEEPSDAYLAWRDQQAKANVLAGEFISVRNRAQAAAAATQA